MTRSRHECAKILLAGLLWSTMTHSWGDEFISIKIKQGLMTGRIERTLSGKKYASYYNIPYARPPVGWFRFKDPIPAEPWTGELNATGPETKMCTQNDFITLLEFGDEDCLVLNVHTPKVSSTSNQNGIEVLVLIHGGGFTFGSAALNSPLYILDKADFIIVSMNYRLDLFGFLSTEDEVIQGNYGLKDQNLALRWVQENIAHFGGDPKKVSLAGFSAGGSSVGYHLISPMSKGLFRGAAMWSGTLFCPWGFRRNPRRRAMELASLVHCPTYDHRAMLDCLTLRSARELLRASKKLRVFVDNFPISPFPPTIELSTTNYFINDSAENYLMKKQALDIPLYLSNTLSEAAFMVGEFLDNGVISSEIERKWNELVPLIFDYVDIYPESERHEISTKMKEEYLSSEPLIGNSRRFLKMMTDFDFAFPAYKFISLFTNNYKSPVHYSRFTFPTLLTFNQLFTYGYSDAEIGPGHADDLLFMFAVIPELKLHVIQPKFKQVSDELLSPIVSLVKGEEQDWPTVNSDPDGMVYKNMGDPSRGKVIEIDTNLGNQKFWKTLPSRLFA